MWCLQAYISGCFECVIPIFQYRFKRAHDALQVWRLLETNIQDAFDSFNSTRLVEEGKTQTQDIQPEIKGADFRESVWFEPLEVEASTDWKTNALQVPDTGWKLKSEKLFPFHEPRLVGRTEVQNQLWQCLLGVFNSKQSCRVRLTGQSGIDQCLDEVALSNRARIGVGVSAYFWCSWSIISS